mgnify:CR=1 FL=1
MAVEALSDVELGGRSAFVQVLTVAGEAPSLASLGLGEIALNVADGKVFVRVGDGGGTDTIQGFVLASARRAPTVATTAPADPEVDDLWVDTSA